RTSHGVRFRIIVASLIRMTISAPETEASNGMFVSCWLVVQRHEPHIFAPFTLASTVPLHPVPSITPLTTLPSCSSESRTGPPWPLQQPYLGPTLASPRHSPPRGPARGHRVPERRRSRIPSLRKGPARPSPTTVSRGSCSRGRLRGE